MPFSPGVHGGKRFTGLLLLTRLDAEVNLGKAGQAGLRMGERRS